MPKKKIKRGARSEAVVPQIAASEWIIMEVAWNRGEVTAKQVVDALKSRTDWKPQTIQTLLRRLVEKGALSYIKQGREFLFRPQVSSAECKQAVSRSFLDRVFNGRMSSMVNCFIESGDFTDEDIEELKKILDGGAS